MQASRNNEDAPEEQHEIADAKKSQPRLVCQKWQPRIRGRSPPQWARGVQSGGHSDHWHRSRVRLGHQGIQHQSTEH